MKKLLMAAALPLALASGCAGSGADVALVVGVETATRFRCPNGVLETVALLGLRAGHDAALAARLSDEQRRSIAAARAETDAVCGIGAAPEPPQEPAPAAELVI